MCARLGFTPARKKSDSSWSGFANRDDSCTRWRQFGQVCVLAECLRQKLLKLCLTTYSNP